MYVCMRVSVCVCVYILRMRGAYARVRQYVCEYVHVREINRERDTWKKRESVWMYVCVCCCMCVLCSTY